MISFCCTYSCLNDRLQVISVHQHQVLPVRTQSCSEKRHRHRRVSLHSGHLQGTHWRQRLLAYPEGKKKMNMSLTELF